MSDTPRSFAYLDYNATSPLLPEVADAMRPIMLEHFGNPSSPHQSGRAARSILDAARIRIAEHVGADPHEIIFTSGGTEGNNTILHQVLYRQGPQHIITSLIEHPSVLATCRLLESFPHIRVSYLPVDSEGLIDPRSLEKELCPDTSLISIMAANNETGTLQPLPELVEIARSRQVPFHSDCVQVLGKMPIHWKNMQLDYATGTAHKLGGPKGIGILYVRKHSAFEAFMIGGQQERVRRAGTESIALAYGFSQALSWHLARLQDMQAQWKLYKTRILERLHTIDGFFLNGSEATCLPNTLNVGFKGISGESLLIALDLAGIGVSMGSACSSGAMQASPVLLAMGRSKAQAKSSIRVSMGWGTTLNDIDFFLDQVPLKVERLYEKKRCGTRS